MKLFVLITVICLILSGCSCNREQDTNMEQDVKIVDEGTLPDSQAPVGEYDKDTTNVVPKQNEEGMQKYLDLLKLKAAQEFIADYTLEGKGDVKIKSVQKWYVKGDNMRIDSTMGEMTSQMYLVDNEVTVCSQNPEFVCIKLQGDDQEAVKQFKQTDKLEEHPEDFAISIATPKNIAGHTAFCFNMVEKKENGLTALNCFSKEGVPLYSNVNGVLENNQEVNFVMQATSYSTKVPKNSFVVPEASADLADLMKELGDLQPPQ